MSGYLNRATLIGNLGRDPEVRHTQRGGRVVTLSIATSESWKDDRGERQERTEWHRVVVFNESLGEIIEKYLTKGAKVFVEGQLRTRKWQDQSGADRYSTEIVLSPYNGEIRFLDGARRSEEGQDRGADGATAPPPRAGGDLHDDIPF